MQTALEILDIDILQIHQKIKNEQESIKLLEEKILSNKEALEKLLSQKIILESIHTKIAKSEGKTISVYNKGGPTKTIIGYLQLHGPSKPENIYTDLENEINSKSKYKRRVLSQTLYILIETKRIKKINGMYSLQ